MRVVSILANVRWRAFRGSSGAWLAACDELNLTVQGDTWAELMEATVEAVNLILDDLVESGEFEQFLKSKGWSTVTPAPSQGEQVLFDLPMDFVRSNESVHD